MSTRVIRRADFIRTLLLSAAVLVAFAPNLHAQSSALLPVVTDADEIRIGKVLAGKLETADGLEATPQTRKIDQYLQKVGGRVAAYAQRKLPYQFHYHPDPTFKSAEALPGGQIYVGAGILAYADSEDQLAVVLGHEIEHVALNHCHDRLVQFLSEKHLSVRDADKLDVNPFGRSFGNEKEFAADREGVNLCDAGWLLGGRSSSFVTDFFLTLSQQMPNTPHETQEHLKERIARIEALSRESTLPKPTKETPLALP